MLRMTWIVAVTAVVGMTHAAWCQTLDVKPAVPAPAKSPTADPKDEKPTDSKPVTGEKTPPKGEVIFFQALNPGLLVGTGFFVKTPKGEIIGATSIHFLDFDEGPLESIAWLGADLEDIASSKKALGQPGIQPREQRDPDYHADYMLFSLDAPPKIGTPLEFDDRASPRAQTAKEPGERLWFPVFDGAVKPDGIRWVTGEVLAASPKAIKIQLDEPLELQGTSGTPVLSQETGKVIGVMSAGATGILKATAYLAPARTMWEVMTAAESKGERPVLKTIDWSKHGEVKPKSKKPAAPNQPETPTKPDPDDN